MELSYQLLFQYYLGTLQAIESFLSLVKSNRAGLFLWFEGLTLFEGDFSLQGHLNGP